MADCCAHHSVCQRACAHACSCACAAADAIAGWTLAEQDAFIAAPVGPQQFAHCIGIVDATYIRIQRPKNALQERRLYSTYKKYHAVFFMAIIDRAGQLQHAALQRVREQLADCALINLFCYPAQAAFASWTAATRPLVLQKRQCCLASAPGCGPRCGCWRM